MSKSLERIDTEGVSSAQLTLGELARRINAHLKRFEADPTINAASTYFSKRTGKQESSGKPFYSAAAGYSSGAKLYVSYVSYQHTAKLSKAEAVAYLAWLDAGNVGRHYEALRGAQAPKEPSTAAKELNRSGGSDGTGKEPGR